MNSSQDTPINFNTNAVLDAIGGLRQHIDNSITGLRQHVENSIGDLRQEMNQRFNNVEARLRFVEDEVKEVKERLTSVETQVTNIETQVTKIDARVAHIESEFFSFNVRLKRVEAGVLEASSIGKNLEADMMVVKAEILAWSHDVMSLQRKVA